MFKIGDVVHPPETRDIENADAHPVWNVRMAGSLQTSPVTIASERVIRPHLGVDYYYCSNGYYYRPEWFKEKPTQTFSFFPDEEEAFASLESAKKKRDALFSGSLK